MKNPASGQVHTFPERVWFAEQALHDVAEPEHWVQGRVHGSQAWVVPFEMKNPAVGHVQLIPERVLFVEQASHEVGDPEHWVQGRVHG